MLFLGSPTQEATMAGRGDGDFIGVPIDQSSGSAFRITFPTQTNGGDGKGDVILFLPSVPAMPEVGDEVLVAFEHGDVHRPAHADTITFTFTVQPTGLEDYWAMG
jgi:hypothetical protein